MENLLKQKNDAESSIIEDYGLHIFFLPFLSFLPLLFNSD